MLALACVAAATLTSCAPEVPHRPHVIVWLVDTLRADHLGCYGYARDTSPVIDGLARDGVRFDDLHVHSNWTQPSVVSLYSGRYPPTFSEAFTSTVPEGLTMLAEWLGAHDYATAGLTVTVATAARFGFDAGYETYEELDWRHDPRARKMREGSDFDAARLVDGALGWLDRRGADERPFLLTLHSVDPHLPYEAHPELPSFTGPYDGPLDGSAADMGRRLREGYPFTAADRRHLVDMYDDEVRYNDAQLGRLLEGLDQRGLRRDTLVVVVSDHGEELFERGRHGHGESNLHAELSHVPLVLSWPGGLPAGRIVDGLVRAVDLLPTLCELTGLPTPEGLDGVSLAAVARGEVQRPERGAVVFLDQAKGADDALAMRTEALLLHQLHGEAPALYDLTSDAEARVDRAAQRPREVDDLSRRLSAWRRLREEESAALRGEQGAVGLDDETRAALQALGYLGGEGDADGR